MIGATAMLFLAPAHRPCGCDAPLKVTARQPDDGGIEDGCCGQLISNSLPSGSFIPTA